MNPKFLSLAIACLLAACGRVGEHDRTSSAVARERGGAKPPTAASMPQQSAPQQPAAPRVEMPAREALSDPAITQRIRSALLGDPQMSGADVSINTDNGVVVLSGTVKSHEQTGIASAHAQRQDGVMRVDNHLRPEVS